MCSVGQPDPHEITSGACYQSRSWRDMRERTKQAYQKALVCF